MDKFLSMLGLACKARKLAVGTKAATDSIRSETAKLTLLASDSASNAEKRIVDACASHEIPLYRLVYTKAQIGQALGTGEAAAVTVNDPHFAKAITNLMTTNEILEAAGTSDPREVQ